VILTVVATIDMVPTKWRVESNSVFCVLNYKYSILYILYVLFKLFPTGPVPSPHYNFSNSYFRDSHSSVLTAARYLFRVDNIYWAKEQGKTFL
jgi:hypothetical protein